MLKNHSVLVALALVIVLVIWQSAFIVPMTEQDLVLQFGDPVAQYTEPGLKFKTPFVQDVVTFDKRVLNIETPPVEVILADQKRLMVETFARYKISDMLQFYKSLQTEEQANARLDNIINSALRGVLGSYQLVDVIKDKRAESMEKVNQQVETEVKDFGIKIVDIQIVSAELPKQTISAIYDRMRTERQREAAQFRAQGKEQAQEIRSKADKERTVLLADAGSQAQISRGEGDAEASRIYAAAYKRDPEFYAFYRTMQAYRESLPGDNTTFVLSPDSEFLQYLKGRNGKQ